MSATRAYYEWRAAAGGKQPFFISAADGAVLSIAGHKHVIERFAASDLAP